MMSFTSFLRSIRFFSFWGLYLFHTPILEFLARERSLMTKVEGVVLGVSIRIRNFNKRL
jgi:hypothetical protein